MFNFDYNLNFTSFNLVPFHFCKENLERSQPPLLGSVLQTIQQLARMIFNNLLYLPSKGLNLIRNYCKQNDKKSDCLGSHCSLSKQTQSKAKEKTDQQLTPSLASIQNREEIKDDEDIYLRRIKRLAKKPKDFIDRSQRFSPITFDHPETSCGTTLYAALFAFSDGFVNPRLDIQGINKELLQPKAITQLIDSLNQGKNKLLKSDSKQGILYAIGLKHFDKDGKFYGGHSFIIQQLPPHEKKLEVTYRIYQSYIDCYSLQTFMNEHPHFLKLSHKEIEDFCIVLQKILSKESWDDECDSAYKQIFCVSHPELIGLDLTSEDKTSLMQLFFIPIDYFVEIPSPSGTIVPLSDDEKRLQLFEYEGGFIPCYMENGFGRLIPNPLKSNINNSFSEEPKIAYGIYYETYKQLHPDYV